MKKSFRNTNLNYFIRYSSQEFLKSQNNTVMEGEAVGIVKPLINKVISCPMDACLDFNCESNMEANTKHKKLVKDHMPQFHPDTNVLYICRICWKKFNFQTTDSRHATSVDAHCFWCLYGKLNALAARMPEHELQFGEHPEQVND